MATTTVLELSKLSESYNAAVRTTSKTSHTKYTTSPKASGYETPPPQIEAATTVLAGQPEFCLPPTDRGRSAWLFLAASFLIEAVVWGKQLGVIFFRPYTVLTRGCLGEYRISIFFWPLPRLLSDS